MSRARSLTKAPGVDPTQAVEQLSFLPQQLSTGSSCDINANFKLLRNGAVMALGCWISSPE
jgi:hypothetical protein